jgi:hypothetical protein
MSTIHTSGEYRYCIARVKLGVIAMSPFSDVGIVVMLQNAKCEDSIRFLAERVLHFQQHLIMKKLELLLI